MSTSGWAVDKARQRITGLAADGLGWQEFGEALLDVYTSLVPADAIVVGSTDPESGVLTDLIRCGIDNVHDELFMRIELTEPDPITLTTLAQTPTGVGILADHLDGDPQGNARCRQLLAPTSTWSTSYAAP